MVKVHITDTSTVTVDGKTVTGPCDFEAWEVTAASTSYDAGVIIVEGGVVAVASAISPIHVHAAPYAISLFVIIGLVLGMRSLR